MLTDISKLKYFGIGSKIYEMAKIVNEHGVVVGDGTQIDDFSFINGAGGIIFGRFNHICSFTTIIGGGELITEDYVGLSAGCRIITGTQGYEAGKHMVPTVPAENQEVIRGKIVMRKDSFLGSNVIVYPNVTIGEGAIVGAGAVVLKDIEPWTINVGIPCRTIGIRPKVVVD